MLRVMKLDEKLVSRYGDTLTGQPNPISMTPLDCTFEIEGVGGAADPVCCFILTIAFALLARAAIKGLSPKSDGTDSVSLEVAMAFTVIEKL